jgi:formylglycine-generating enzyme required for sulfatase activity
MKYIEKSGIFFLLVVLFSAFGYIGAQNVSSSSRYALVIGNSNYSDLGSLKNPENDAKDMAATLGSIGFTVKLLLDADLILMETEVERLKTNLSQRADSIGFFYYAGHGVQSQGSNYLIPADARILGENYLRVKALALQTVLDNLNDSRNALNIVVLDACRDNPYSWARSGTRGLSIVGTQPSGSIVVYATSAGSTAQDGAGKNGVFTAELLKHLGVPGVDINDVFKRTGAGVQSSTNGKQVPAIYNQFFGTTYLAGTSSVSGLAPPSTTSTISIRPPQLQGSLQVRTENAGTIYLDRVLLGEIRRGGAQRIPDLDVGYYDVEIRYPTGQRETKAVRIEEGKEIVVSFTEGTPPITTTTTTTISTPTITTIVPASRIEMVYVQRGSFTMGSNSGDPDEKPTHRVTISSFMIGKYEITQDQYRAAMGTNPSYFASGSDAGKRPVEQVSWYDAVAFCNRLSEMEGLEKVYVISGSNVNVDFDKKGYRLPTEAEWEYAARGGTQSRNYTYSGSNDINQAGWYSGNSGSTTHGVGAKAPNELGIYDMSGNVWEWCWDWYGAYKSDAQADSLGASSGGFRVLRGGSWYDGAGGLRSANRDNFSPDFRDLVIGFRVARRL